MQCGWSENDSDLLAAEVNDGNSIEQARFEELLNGPWSPVNNDDLLLVLHFHIIRSSNGLFWLDLERAENDVVVARFHFNWSGVVRFEALSASVNDDAVYSVVVRCVGGGFHGESEELGLGEWEGKRVGFWGRDVDWEREWMVHEFDSLAHSLTHSLTRNSTHRSSPHS